MSGHGRLWPVALGLGLALLVLTIFVYGGSGLLVFSPPQVRQMPFESLSTLSCLLTALALALLAMLWRRTRSLP